MFSKHILCWQQRVQSKRDSSDGKRELAAPVVFSNPRGSEDEVMHLEFQAMAYQAGRTAAPTGTRLIQTPATQVRQAPQQKGPKQRHGANGSPSALVLLPALATRSLGHVRRSASDDAPVAKCIQQGNVVKPCCDLHLTY